ncbi:MAG: hypothetical protein D6729_11040 [Deltaproteobacteria bacterium]|nr:MAG: hypothetical protein D6729_11040 [Deltaproteobacteria bacterium]
MASRKKSKPKRDPVLAAAVIRLSFERQGEAGAAFRTVYEGVLRDHGITDEEVRAYLREHREEVERLARGSREA